MQFPGLQLTLASVWELSEEDELLDQIGVYTYDKLDTLWRWIIAENHHYFITNGISLTDRNFIGKCNAISFCGPSKATHGFSLPAATVHPDTCGLKFISFIGEPPPERKAIFGKVRGNAELIPDQTVFRLKAIGFIDQRGKHQAVLPDTLL